MRGFLNYFEAMLRSPKLKSYNLLNFLGIFVVAVSCYYGIASMNFGAFALSFLAGFVFVTASMCGSAYFNNTPNLVSQLPISPEKSLFYRFLSALVLYLLMMLFIMAICLAVTLIVSGIVLLSGVADSDSGGSVSEEIETMTPMGVHGGIFAAAYFVFMYGMGMVCSFIKKGKIVNIVTVSTVVAVLVGMLLMRNPFIQESYDKMAVPWLCTALCCLSAAAALGTAIYLGIKQYNKIY